MYNNFKLPGTFSGCLPVGTQYMDIRITPKKLKGRVTVPMSKSYAIRLALGMGLSEAPAPGPGSSMDVDAAIRVSHFDGFADCGQSATVLRLGIAIAAALGVETEFTGNGSLLMRPIKDFLNMLSEHGVTFSDTKLPFKMTGKLIPGNYVISGNVTSQYVSGLLMALPLLDGDSTITIVDPPQSGPYIDMTVAVMKTFGVDVISDEKGRFYTIKGNQKYKSWDVICERDWSAAAFWFAANALGCDITIDGLNHDTTQGDKTVEYLISRLGRTINLNNTPDLAPPLAAAACGIDRTTVFTGCARLRYKESDRVETIINMINDLGGRAFLEEGDIFVVGSGKLPGGTVESLGDHRIAMAAAVLSCCCDGPVIIKNAECVSKSYPAFFDDFKSLGGEFDVI